MDFVEQLSKSQGKDTILVVICRLKKYDHFIALQHPFIVVAVAKTFLDTIFKLHGLPVIIIANRDKIFTTIFLKELFKAMGTKLAYSSSYHPQYDGQSKILNQSLECYLRYLSFQYPYSWAKWLFLAKWWYNTSHHNALKISPFEALNGYQPSSLVFIPPKDTKVEVVVNFVYHIQ